MKNQPLVFFSGLNALRGVAAILVAVFHFEQLFGGQMIPRSGSQIIEKSYLMVDLFFILSGFVIAHIYGNDFEKGFEWQVFRKFLAARVARIYPLHLVTLLFMASVFFLPNVFRGIETGRVYTWPLFFSNLFLVQSWGVHQTVSFNTPAWSISTEWFAYLLFPVLWRFLKANRAGGLLLILVLTWGGVVLFTKISRHGNLDVTFDFGVVRCLFGFLAGLILYKFWEKGGAATAFFSKNWVGWMAIFFTFLALHFGLADWAIWCAFLFLIFSVSKNDGRLDFWLSKKAFQWLGKVSYSIYLIHYPLILVLQKGFSMVGIYDFGQSLGGQNWWGVFGIYLFLLLVFSGLSFLKIEKPSRKWWFEQLTKIKI